MNRQRRQIPPGRKALYYAGMALSGIGILLFLSVFVTSIANFGDFTDFRGQARSAGFRAVGGMILFGLGTFVMQVGARGAAGSGVILDPEKAREDVEPWSRLTGGVLKDALDEADIDLGRPDDRRPETDDALPFDEKLRRLHRLREDGILTDEEYEREKREILDRH